MGLMVERDKEAQRSKWLQVRMSQEELDTLRELSKAYDQDVSDFIRNMIRWIDDKRPELRIAPKGVALAQ